MRTFSIRTEPILAQVGEVTLAFVPEADGTDFAQAYDELRTAQKKLKSSKDEDGIDPKVLAGVSGAMRSFIASFLTDESRPVFDGMKLPDRVLTEMLQYCAELYGGGSGNPAAGGGTSTA